MCLLGVLSLMCFLLIACKLNSEVGREASGSTHRRHGHYNECLFYLFNSIFGVAPCILLFRKKKVLVRHSTY